MVAAEQVPWATGTSPVTKQFAAFLALRARKLSGQEPARCFHLSWDMVADGVSWVVQWGLAQRDLDKNTAIGVDEIQYKKWQPYISVIAEKRLSSALDRFYIVANLTKALDEARRSKVLDD